MLFGLAGRRLSDRPGFRASGPVCLLGRLGGCGSRLGSRGSFLGRSLLGRGLFGGSFFTLTGFHGAHVVIGLVWLGLLMFRAFGVMGGFSRQDNMGVEVFGLYWHFVDIVWLLLFSLVYLI